ncbi:potassium transporter Kup [Peredibacter sp. HCB2-198]|uniref:potassium transporter Kup n=1 Tax=Peredibacter sp. HCB2-198 TaxID=3383025 RepID=UPI0038B62098
MKSNDESKLNLATGLAALGVVYGDIGTSPLYAFKESFHHTHDLLVNTTNVYGILSLIFWSLISVVSIKYLVFIVRADNQGEGGVLALTALLQNLSIKSRRLLGVLTLFGIFGTALLYGDGMITPAISVLSAVEGLEFITPALHSYIIPITIAILIALFSIQRHGTAVVGKVFGPVTLTWFIVIGILGIYQIAQGPSILAAVNPYYAIKFFHVNAFKGFTVLGSVFLCVTGGEALYSDLGHFGKGPIRLAWFAVVLPCLILCYFGQGALILQNPEAVKNPFYLMAPEWALIPLVALATLSTCIASQALITGVFSLTMQAVQLQYVPRVTIDHTSEEEFGQIYVRTVNFLLMIACIALVVTFRSSSNLAAAYGIAVTTTMVITTILFYFVARYSWNWHPLVALPLCLFFLVIEGSFFGANLLKVLHGGWFPLLVGIILYTLMTTWNRGRQILAERMLEYIMPLPDFLNEIRTKKPVRVPGVAIYMSGHPQYVPPTLYQSYRHFNCIHEHLVFLSVHTSDIPHVPVSNRVKLQDIGPNIYRIAIEYGFMDLPNVPHDLQNLVLAHNLTLNPFESTYFLGREHLIATERKGMMLWRERLFAVMSRNAQPATRFFQLPRGRVVEIGSVIEL